MGAPHGGGCEAPIANDPAANYDPPECSCVSMHLMHGGQKRFQRGLEKMTRIATVQSVSFVDGTERIETEHEGSCGGETSEGDCGESRFSGNHGVG